MICGSRDIEDKAVKLGRLKPMAAILITAFLLLYCSTAYPEGGIVSLAPSITEILYSLGLEDRIVGVTAFCDYPKEAREKPNVGGMSNPSLEAVVSLRPDIVVMTTDGNPKEFEERLRNLNIKTYVFRARRIAELPSELRKLGNALGVKEGAEELAKEIEDAVERISKKVSGSSGRRLRILFVIWPEPLIVAGPGTAIDDAISILGHKNLVGGTIPYPKYSIEEIIRQEPDLIIIGSGTGMKILSEKLLSRLKSTPALKNKKVFYMSDSLYRLGPRVIEGIKEMAEVIEKGSMTPEATEGGQ